MLKQSKSNARRKSKKHSTPSTASPSPSNLPQFDHGADSEGARLAPVAYPISAEQRSENTSTSSNTSAISVSTSEAESHSEEATFPSTSTSEPLVVPIPETRELHDLFEHEHQHEYGYQHESEHVMMTPQSIGAGGMGTFEDPLIDFTAENQRTKYETPIYEPQIPQPSISPIPVISVPSTSVESESASSESPSLPSPQKKGRGRKIAARGMATDQQGLPMDEPPLQPPTAPTVHHAEEALTPTPAPASLRLWETKGGSGDGETHMAPLSRKGQRSEHQGPSLPASPSSSTRQRTLKARPQIQHDPPSTLSHQYQAKSPADVITSDIHARRGSFGNRGYRHDSQDEESEEQFSPVQPRHPQHRHSPRVSVPYGHSRSTSLGGYASHGMSDDDYQYQSVSPTGGSGSGHGRSAGGVGGVVGRVGGTVGGLISRGVSGISASKSLGAPPAIDRQYEGGGVDTTGRARGSGNAASVSQSSGRDQVLWSKWDVIMPSDRLILILAYARGLQIWDCTDLNAVREILNLSETNFSLPVVGTEEDSTRGSARRDREVWGRVIHAAVLPPAAGSARDGEDVCEGERPVIGIITTVEDQATFVVYSLFKQRVVKKVVFPGLVSFQANEHVIVLSTIDPPTLYILSATSFEVSATITSASLIPFGRKISITRLPPSLSEYANSTPTTQQPATPTSPYNHHQPHRQSIYNNIPIPTTNATSFGNVLLSQFGDERATGDGGVGGTVTPQAPVFALSGRLLAYCSPAPPPQRARDGMQPITSKTTSSAARTLSPTTSSPSQKALGTSGGGIAGGSPPTDATSPSSTFSQASEIGQAALLKVGGSMLSGMKTLGGMAISAAKAKASEQLGVPTSPAHAPTPAHAVPTNSGGGPGLGGTVGSFASRFFSRSAPAASGGEDGNGSGSMRGRRYSTASSSAGSEGQESVRDGTIAPMTGAGTAEKGYYITVVDIKPLLAGSSGATSSPVGARSSTPLSIVSEFLASKHQPIASLGFSSDGTSILVSPKDGQTLQVFKIRPKSLAIRRLSGKISRLADVSPDSRASPQPASSPPQQRRARMSLQMTAATPPSTSRNPSTSRREAGSVVMQEAPLHVYNLRRGRTSAVVEEIDWADDERWVAIGTKNRTIHLFPVNPYGGKPDVKSHLEGLVKNPEELQPLSVDVHPIARVRAQKHPDPQQYQAPLAFTFFRSNPQTLPGHLLPAPIYASRPSRAVGSLGSTPESDVVSPRHTERPRNFQDILVFDPTDSILSLRRVTLELKAVDDGISLRGLPASVPGLGSTSISLPKMVGAGRLGSSPSSGSNAISNAQPTWGRSMAPPPPPTELTGTERVAATWDLHRQLGRAEVRRSISGAASTANKRPPPPRSKADWLSQAELSTYSHSTRILPRSIYLSHQFSFHTLGEDYHALIRRFHFDTVGSKIEVRKEVEASAFSAGIGESFIEGFAPHRDRRTSSSFDEPLASALAAGIDSSRTAPVLPMLPNGMHNSGPASIRNAIPIRTISGNMTDGIGRIRNQLQQRVRSPRSGPVGSSATPLEFDEELEDASARDGLLDNGIIIRGVSRRADGTDLPSLHEDADDLWRTWESQDRLAIEEAETFDDISVVGLLDEEQASLNQKMKVRSRKHGL